MMDTLHPPDRGGTLQTPATCGARTTAFAQRRTRLHHGLLHGGSRADYAAFRPLPREVLVSGVTGPLATVPRQTLLQPETTNRHW